jgi:hypothetical protein
MGIIAGFCLRAASRLTARAGSAHGRSNASSARSARRFLRPAKLPLSVDPRGSDPDVAKPGRVREPGAAFPRMRGRVVIPGSAWAGALQCVAVAGCATHDGTWRDADITTQSRRSPARTGRKVPGTRSNRPTLATGGHANRPNISGKNRRAGSSCGSAPDVPKSAAEMRRLLGHGARLRVVPRNAPCKPLGDASAVPHLGVPIAAKTIVLACLRRRRNAADLWRLTKICGPLPPRTSAEGASLFRPTLLAHRVRSPLGQPGAKPAAPSMPPSRCRRKSGSP